MEMENYYGLNPLKSSFDGNTIITKYKIIEGYALPLKYTVFPTFAMASCKILLNEK